MELDYLLAEKLGMTVGRLRAEMSNQEFIEWSVYLARKTQQAEIARIHARWDAQGVGR